MKSAKFKIECDTNQDAKIIAESINPEIKHKIPKTEISFSIKNKTLYLKIKSKDISSLRAACNSYLRWINTALNVKKTI